MTNKSSAKKHCFVGADLPKSKLRKRHNKATARVNRAKRQEELATLLSAKK